jgi:hypothetical protein
VGGGSRPNIPADAEWLWTNNNNNHDRVYCRSMPYQISTSSPSQSIIKVSADDTTVVIKSSSPTPKAEPKAAPTPKPAPTPKAEPKVVQKKK